MSSRTSRILDLMRPDIWDIEPYAAVEPPEVLAARFGVPLDRVIKLDANENPYGCSPSVQRALADFDRYHIYPDPLCGEVQELLQRYTGAAADRIVVGNGSDEIIDIIMRLFLNPGDQVISCPPTFGYYQSSAAFCAAKITRVARTNEHNVDVDAVLDAIDDRTKLIVLASPNNPTGNGIADFDLRSLLDVDIPLVVDEAYGEFAGKTALALTEEYENLIVIRTFSKWAGLAGLRFGYGIFPTNLVAHVIKMKPPYNVSLAAQVAVRASLEDLEYLLQKVEIIRVERERLYRDLKEIDFLEPYPSEANFILCKLRRGELRQVRKSLETQGIFLRYYDDPMLIKCLRLSVGTPEQNDIVLEKLRALSAEL